MNDLELQNGGGMEGVSLIKKNKECFVHPELQNDEIFLVNLADEEDWKNNPWKTKRRGIKSYNYNGSEVGHGHFPVFVKREEVEKEGLKIDEELRKIKI
ncbi:MAG: hypothetical protein V1910_00710 [bacterium]